MNDEPHVDALQVRAWCEQQCLFSDSLCEFLLSSNVPRICEYGEIISSFSFS